MTTIELTDDEYDFLKWAVKYHHWCNRLSIEVYPPNEKHLLLTQEENKMLEGMFSKFGLTEQEITEHEADIVIQAQAKIAAKAARKR